MAENYLRKLELDRYCFRPAYIYPVHKRKEPNFMYTLSRALYPLIRLFGKNVSIKSTQLARASMSFGSAPGMGNTLCPMVTRPILTRLPPIHPAPTARTFLINGFISGFVSCPTKL